MVIWIILILKAQNFGKKLDTNVFIVFFIILNKDDYIFDDYENDDDDDDLIK